MEITDEERREIAAERARNETEKYKEMVKRATEHYYHRTQGHAQQVPIDPLPVMERVAVYLEKVRNYDDDSEYLADVLEALSDIIAQLKCERRQTEETDNAR